jgi:3-oxoacyl-[acyl-carrier-protein] synthase-1
MSIQDNPIVITAMSGVTPVGGNIDQTCAAIASGINLFEDYEYYECQPHDPEWDPPLPLIASCFSLIEPELEGYQRLVSLGVQCLKELMPKSKLKRKDLGRCGLLLALPQKDEVVSKWALEDRYIQQITRTTGLTSFATTGSSCRGSAGVFSLLNRAQSMIESGEVDCCIVGGIDTYIDYDRLDLYDSQWRIKSERNVDGFIPGEGAVMFLLEKASAAANRNIEKLAALSKVVGDVEPNNIRSGKNSSGTGLGNAIAKLQQITGLEEKIAWTFSDMNGESYRGYEWGIVLVRHNALFDEQHLLDHPADCVGESGAAGGALLVAQAAFSFAKGMNAADNALIYVSSDQGERAAMLVQKIH